jgi:hypothetical protein
VAPVACRQAGAGPTSAHSCVIMARSDSLDALSTDALLSAAVDCAHADRGEWSDESWDHVRALHRRPERAVFDRAANWCRHGDVIERSLGATVLAQLGLVGENDLRPFTRESVPILLDLLGDADAQVVSSATYALAHQRAGTAEDFRRLAEHPSEDVRYAAAHVLGGRKDPLSIALLLTLMTDVDGSVRDWATYSIGSGCDIDTPEIRDALAARLADADEDVRGEAMVGLATRGDARAIAPIVQALASDDPSHLVFNRLVVDAANLVIERGDDDGEVSGALERWRTGSS